MTGTQPTTVTSDRQASENQPNTAANPEQSDTGTSEPVAEMATNQQEQNAVVSEGQPEAAATQEQVNTPATQEQQEPVLQQIQQEQIERDFVPVVLIDVSNPEADNAANASAVPQPESIQPAAEAMDVDNDVPGEANMDCYCFSLCFY